MTVGGCHDLVRMQQVVGSALVLLCCFKSVCSIDLDEGHDIEAN